MESTSNSNKILIMGLIGFAAGILLAPDKGTVTRDKLKTRADELTDKAKEKRDQAKSKLHELRKKKDEAVEDTRSKDLNTSSERLVP
jgi:gas vesicle protein